MNYDQFSPSGTGITSLVSSLTVLSLLSQGRMASLVNPYGMSLTDSFKELIDCGHVMMITDLAERLERIAERECLDNCPMSCV